MRSLSESPSRRSVGAMMAILLLISAVLLPGVISRCKAEETSRVPAVPQSAVSGVPQSGEIIRRTPVSVVPQEPTVLAQADVRPEPAVVVAPVVEKTAKYIVRKGDVLSRVFPKSWKQVCEENYLRDCNRIVVGQELMLPQGSVVEVSKKAVRQAITRSADGWQPISRLNVSPYGKHRTEAKDIWKILGPRGYSFDEIYEYLVMRDAGKCTSELFSKGQKFPWMSFGDARVLEKLRATWDEPEVGLLCQLSTGRNVVIMQKCGNLTEVEPRALPRVVIPVVEKAAPPPLVIEGTSQPEKPVPCPLDPKLVIGQEHEPRHSGNDAHSTFLSAAVYCTWRGEKGTHGVGVGAQASWWEGAVNNGAGNFKGNLAAIGPAYEYVSDDNWDMEMKLLFGRLNESFSQGDYESERAFNLGAVSVAGNWYDREAEGKKAFAKTQVFGIVGVPLSRQASHSWQGQPIADTSQLEDMGMYFNVGVRQELYNFTKLKLYTDLGYFLETPTTESMSFRVGFTDPNSICGIGFGRDFDLKHGGSAKAWGWWCDVAKGVKVLRTKHRADQIVEDIPGASVVNGIIMIPTIDVSPSKSVVSDGGSSGAPTLMQ